MNSPTEINVNRPTGMAAQDVPSGFCWFRSFQKDDFFTIYYKTDGRIQWLIRHDENKESVMAYKYNEELPPIKEDSYNCDISYFLGEQFQILKRQRFFDLFINKDNLHPTSDWILFNVDWLVRMR